MKGSYLGEFQEVVLLSILAVGEEAYGVSIQAHIKEKLQRNVSRGALHAVLVRLEEKKYIESYTGGATAERGGRRKRYYRVTNAGLEAVRETRDMRNRLWSAIPELST